MKLRVLLFFATVLWALNAGAQAVFPLQVSQQFGTFPTRLADFSSDPLAQYQVAVQLMDPFEPSVQVQLKLRIEGPNLRLTSRAGMASVIHRVDFGAPLQLSGADLNYLFAPGNLVVEGMDARTFWQEGGFLQEGFYNVCLEAFLPNQTNLLGASAENCQPLFVTVAEPPIVTYPIANQTVPALTPANFAITWLDQGGGGLVNYDLEVTPLGNTPGLMQLSGGSQLPTSNNGFGTIRQNLAPVNNFSNDVFFPAQNGIIAPGAVVNANAPVLFRTGLNGLTYQLQPDDPVLLQGSQYLVRVRAYDPLGERAFRNGGWSQPVVFTYGERCPAPVNVVATPVSDSQVRLSWANTALTAAGYTLRYRISNDAQDSWTEISSPNPSLLIAQLQQNTAYRYELRANCSGTPGNSVFGNFSTPGLPNTGGNEDNTTPTTNVFADNGDTPYQPEIAACSPDASLATIATGQVDADKKVVQNETFKYYGLDIRAVQVGGATNFNGKGTLLVPWLEQGAVAVNFRDIKLNSAGEAVRGTVTPIRASGNNLKTDLSKFKATLGVTEACSNYTETQLDERGFDDAGIHYLTGTEYDPYGFDQDGNYQGQDGQLTDGRGFNAAGEHGNGTPYDDNGCDRDSLNQYGQPCVWRQHGGASGNQNAGDAGSSNDPPTGGNNDNSVAVEDGIFSGESAVPGTATVAGTAYLGTISEDSLASLLQVGIDTMLNRIDLTLAGYSGIRSLLATGLDYYLQLTNLDRALLIGPNDEYLQAGMSSLFPSGIPAADSLDRDLDYWLYDKAIRGLYQVDKHTVDTLQPLQILYREHRTSVRAQQLLEHLQRHLRALNQNEINGLNNTAALREWVRHRISIQVSALFANPNAGYSEWTNPGEDLLKKLVATPLLAGDAGWREPPPPNVDLPELLRSLSITSYNPALGFELPLKIEREIGGKKYQIFIDDLKFGATGIQVDAFCILPLPGKDGEFVAFKGENIPLTKGGFQGKQKLALVSQLDIGLGTYGTMTFPTNSETYVEFSCDGYEGFSLDGQVLFCRDKLIPVDATGGLLPEPNRVTADFELAGTSWPNFLIKLEADKRFAVKGLRDIYWLGDDIWVDFSEDDSPDVRFPDGYQHAFVGADHKAQDQWRGVHIGLLDVTLDVLAQRQDGSELGFTARDLIVDNSGLSVKANARNLLTKEEGRIGKWKVGVDSVLLHLQQSNFKAARITGDLVFPTDDADEVRFIGQASAGLDFSFSAILEKDKKLSWDMWDGELTLAQNTSFEILRSADDGWNVRAKLYGRMALGVEPTAKFTVPDIVFEDFRLASFKPYLDLGPGGRFGIEGAGVNLGGFGIEVKKLALIRPANGADEFGVDVAGKLSFMKGSSGFGASAGVTVFGDVSETANGLDFDYDRLKVNDIFLATKIPGVMINGGVRFYDKETYPAYGDGFQGMIDARFDGVGLGLKAAAQFGSMSDYRYWFVDAAALLELGISSIPLVGVIHLTGIGGGASYHMTRSDDNAVGQNVDFTQVSTELPPIGTSITNINYVPDQQTGLGLRIMGAMATFPTASVMNGAIIIGAEFTNSFGISKMNLDGSAAFMTPPAVPNGPVSSPTVAAGLSIEYLHRTRELNGSLRGYLNYGGVIVGANTDASGKPNYLGAIDFHASPSRWKLWMGTPQQPLGIKFKPLDLTVGTYLDIGSTLPAFPNLPTEFSGLGLQDLSVPAGARGFMHGLDARIPTGSTPKRFTAWRLRAELRARFGYNMMLTNSIACEGRDNFGIGGWFLQGNAYASFYGGLKFGTSLTGDNFGETVTLASLNAKAAVQLRGPNPTYFEGGASIDYEVLGWKGTHNMQFSFGETCRLINVPPPAIETELYLPFDGLIAYSQPAAGETSVDVMLEPKIFTVEEIGQEILVPQGNRNRRFRIAARASEISLKDLTRNRTVAGRVGTGDQISFNPNGTLSPNRDYELSVRVFLEEKVNGNWVTFQENGQPYAHEQVIPFSTGDLPDLGLIMEVRPGNGSQEVDIFAKPFFRLNNRKLANLDYFFGRNWELDIREAKLYRGETKVEGSFLPGTGYYDKSDFSWEGAQEALEPETDYELRLTVGGTRLWYDERQYLEIGDERYAETVTVSFRTGKRQENIPDEQVVGAYPGKFQYNTYRDLRSANCFLRFGQSLGDILGPDWLDGEENKVIVRYLDNVSRDQLYQETVTVSSDKFEWPALPQQLGLDKTYEVQFIIAPLSGEVTTERNVTVNGTEVAVSPAEPSAGIATGVTIYQYWFRTSAYPNWQAKVAGLNLGNPVAAPRRGVNSPRIWDQPIPAYSLADSVDYPYVDDLTNRALGTDAYRLSNSPGELFSADELEEGGLGVSLHYRNAGYVKTLSEDYFNWSITTNAVTCDGNGATTSIPVTWEDLLPENTLRFRQTVAGPELTNTSGHQLAGQTGVSSLGGLGSLLGGILLDSPDYPTVAEMEADRNKLPGFSLELLPQINGKIILLSQLSSTATIRYNQSWAYRRSFAMLPAGVCDVDDLVNNGINENELNDQINQGNLQTEVDLINNAILVGQLNTQFGGGFNAGGGIDPGNGGLQNGGTLTYNANVSAGLGGTTTNVSVNTNGNVTQFQQGGINQQTNYQNGVSGGGMTTQPGNGQVLPGGGFRLRPELPDWIKQLMVTSNIPYPLPDVRGQVLQVIMEYRVLGPDGQAEVYYSNPIDLSIN